MLNTGGTGALGTAAAGLAAPPRVATMPATAPPATADATQSTFGGPPEPETCRRRRPWARRRTGRKPCRPAPAPSMPESESGTVPECDWPANRAGWRVRCASVITTSVRSPLTNAPPGPSSGRWKLTAAPATGLPVSSVISTVIGRVLRDPGRCTAPSPSITRICRMATWRKCRRRPEKPQDGEPNRLEVQNALKED